MPYPADLPSRIPPSVSQSKTMVDEGRPSESDLRLRDLLLILRRRLGIIIATTILGLAGAVILTISTPKRYSSSTLIEINKQGGGLGALDDLSGLSSQLSGGDQLNIDLTTQETVIESTNTAIKVIESLHLMDAPPYSAPAVKGGKVAPVRDSSIPLDDDVVARTRAVAIFKAGLQVGVVKGTRLLKVTYTDTDPVRAPKIASAIVATYIEQYTQARYEASNKTSAWLTEQLSGLKDKVTESQRKVNDFQRQSGLVGMQLALGNRGSSQSGSQTQSVTLERLVDLNRDLTSAEVTRIAREAIYRMTESQDPDAVLGVASSGLVKTAGNDTVFAPGGTDVGLLQALRQRQVDLKVQLASAETKYGARNPVIDQLQTELQTLQVQIQLELKRIHLRAKNDYDLAVAEESGIQKTVETQEQEVSKQSNSSDQLLLLQQEAYATRTLYQDLQYKLEEAKVAAGVKASNVTVVDPARISLTPSSPQSRRNLIAGFLGGLFLGVSLAFLLNQLDDSLITPDEIEHLTNIPVMGLIPMFNQGNIVRRYGGATKEPAPKEGDSQAWLLREPKSVISEAYRALRTMLMMSRAGRPPQVILITSSQSMEGKSTTCFNTAVAFAVGGKRVLIIDADMRRPSLQRLTGIANTIGLSSCLTGDVKPDDVIHSYPPLPNLFVLPAGIIPPMPSELLDSQRFVDLIAQFRKDYDFVFVDTPPVLLVTDALVISSNVDAFLMVVRSGQTRRSLLKRLLALVARPNLPALGIVMNAANLSSADYAAYGYGKSDYYVDAQ